MSLARARRLEAPEIKGALGCGVASLAVSCGWVRFESSGLEALRLPEGRLPSELAARLLHDYMQKQCETE